MISKKWITAAAVLYLVLALTAYIVGQRTKTVADRECEELRNNLGIMASELAKANDTADKYRMLYQDLLAEIEASRAEDEELTRAFEETSFALDEVCYETGWTQLGTFTISWYCACKRCCGKWAGGCTASGTVPTDGRTVAVDPSVIPLGTKVRINGHEYIAEDTGVNGHWIDIFVNSHEQALQNGLQKMSVEVAV